MRVLQQSQQTNDTIKSTFTTNIKRKRKNSNESKNTSRFQDVEAVVDSGPGSSGSAGSMSKSLNGSLRSLGTRDTDMEGDNINVVVRVRPLNPKEEKVNEDIITQFPGDGQLWVAEGEKGDKLKPYTFNVVFEPEATQADIIQHSGMKRLIDMAIDGFSTTIFCYGQTGSGKTHTLTGPPYLMIGTNGRMNKDHGLVFRSFIYLFEQLKRRSEESTFVIKASYLEIYNEKVLDLINPGAKRSNLAVRWNKRTRSFVVDNLFSIECSELDDLVAVLEEGLKNRAIGSHNMNEHSSRSHTILTVHIHSEEKAGTDDNKGVFITRHGKINFVDLAGSEMTKKTRSEGKTLTEANNINKSLMVLGYCIAQLSSAKKSDKGTHIPYRDSKLTKLLADSLAGNGVTLMIACVSPAKSNLSETSNTLRYAARAKRIRTKPIVVMDPREALIVSLKREVGILTAENNHLRQLVDLADGDMPHLALLGQGAPSDGRATPATSKRIDKQRLNELDSSTLVDLIKDYMRENQDLRKENMDLFSIRDMMVRDQELVCKENERLLKKLEDVNSVCCRSPIIPARPSYSAELMSLSYNGSLPRSSGSAPDLTAANFQLGSSPAHHAGSSPQHDAQFTELWTNPLHDVNGMEEDHKARSSSLQSRSSGSLAAMESRRPHRLPDNINKELEKRKIGPRQNSMSGIADSLRNNKSSKSSGESEGSPDELFPTVNRRKHGQLTDTIGLQRTNSTVIRKESKDGSEFKKGNIRKERAKKLRGQSMSRERINYKEQ